jgi:hypothetical protein
MWLILFFKISFKNHAELDKMLDTCPFNALHRMMPDKKKEHMLECVDRVIILNQRTAG